MTKHSSRQNSKPPFYRRKGFLWTIGIIISLIAAILLWFKLSPWPGAMIIRYEFNSNGRKVAQAMEKYTPKEDTFVINDQQYASKGKDTTLDVYIPEEIQQTDKKLPVVIWTHGGAWLSGDKKDAATYYKLIAQQNFVVISLNYSLAPESTYPKAIHEINTAYSYIKQNSERFHADTTQVLLAGDSAGANITAQMAALITNPSYSKEVNISPNLQSSQLKGVILNCGIYKMEELAHPNPNLSRLIGWGDDVTVWAYSGTNNFSDPIIRQMSPYYHVNSTFPPTYISGGNADPLTNVQSKPFASKLQSLGVEVESLFYKEDHQPKLGHEYQFNLDNEDAKNALKMTIEFSKNKTK